jgi:glycosyl transferase family 25
MKNFVSIKIIHLEHRLDRREECESELARIGWGKGDYSFFSAKHLPDFGARGCALSHGKAIADFLFEEEKPFLLVLEDDVCVRPGADLVQDLQMAIEQAPLWDVFLLAHNAPIPIARTPLNGAYRVVNARTTSGYLVGRLYAPKLLELFFRSAEMLREVKDIPSPAREIAGGIFRCDMLWNRLQESDRFWAKIPSLTFQRPSYSDIEKKMADYKV